MKTQLLVAIIFMTTLSVSSQTTFQKTYGGPDIENGMSAQQTTDGGYILFGQTMSFGSGGLDMYLIKTDNQGNEQWSHTYGGTNWEFGISVQQTTDGGYILCGGYSGLSNDSLALIKTDQNGNEIWNKRFSGTIDSDMGEFVQQTIDGGFIAVGFTGPIYSEHIYMVKTDVSGNEQWSKTHISTGREIAFGVRETSDGGYAMIGETNSVGFGGKDMYLVKTNSTGNILWTKTYGTTSDEIGMSLCITSDNGFIMLGYEESISGDLLLIKADSLGNEQWSEYYGGTGKDQGYSVQQTTDGGYILAGQKENTINSKNEMYCIKTDNTGGIEWSYTYPKGMVSDANMVQQTTDGGYILFGSTIDTIGGLNSDMFLVKINGSGLISIDNIGLAKTNILAYPNPFTEYTTIKFDNKEKQEISFVLISNQGRIVRSIKKTTTDKVRIERGNLASGIYFLQLLSNKQIITTTKLIIQ